MTIRNRILPVLLAIPIISTSCEHAPAVDVLGSFFPIWIICVLAGILARVLTRRLLLRFGTDYDYGPPVLIYPSLTIFFACLIWLVSSVELTMATTSVPPNSSNRRARLVGALIVVAAVAICCFTFWQTNVHPRTDDAWFFANLIGIAPEVEGPVMKLHVRDNQLVKAGDVLFEIEAQPYEYALQRALSEQQALEKQIYNENRVIAGQQAAIEAAQATVFMSEAHISSAEANVNSGRANVENAEAGISRAEAEYKLANDTLHRLEPLLARQFVTAEDVDRARTQQQTASEALRQARSQFELLRHSFNPLWRSEVRRAPVSGKVTPNWPSRRGVSRRYCP